MCPERTQQLQSDIAVAALYNRDGQELPPALGRDMVSLFEKYAQQMGVAKPVPPPRPPPGSALMGSSQPRPPPPRPPGFRNGMGPAGGMGGGGMSSMPMADPNAIVFNEMGVPMGNLGSLQGMGVNGGMANGGGGVLGGGMGMGGMGANLGGGMGMGMMGQGTHWFHWRSLHICLWKAAALLQCVALELFDVCRQARPWTAAR